MSERQFRISIYCDVSVPATDDLEADRITAAVPIFEIQRKIPNSFIGGVGLKRQDLKNPLDRDI